MKSKEKYFICIGTSKSILDGAAPKVGTELKKIGYNVLGTEKEQLNAKNLYQYYDKIRKLEKTYRVIAVDASISLNNNPSIITHISKPCCPGKGIGNQLYNIGHETIHLNVFKGLPDTELKDIFIKPEEDTDKSKKLSVHVDMIVRLCIRYITGSENPNKIILNKGEI